MAKQPYIPIYIGDWEQDLNCVSLEAEGAALKLVFKLWKAPQRGLLTVCFAQMAILFKKSEPETRKIFDELRQNKIFDIKILNENEVEIISRRMWRESQLSKVRSDIGKKGVKVKKNLLKQNASKHQANIKQNPEYDNEYDNEVEVENEIKGVQGETLKIPTLAACEIFFQQCDRTREEGEKFFHHYQAQGWKVGNGQPITDWASLAQKWILNPKENKNGKIVDIGEQQRKFDENYARGKAAGNTGY